MIFKNENEIFDYWYMKRDLAPASKIAYSNAMNLFLDKLNYTILDLYNSFQEIKENNEDIDETYFGFQIIKIFDELKKNPDFSSRYVKQVHTSLQSFCKTFKFILPEIKIKTNNKRCNIRRLPEKHEIRKALSISSPRNKAIISIAIMSGMRCNEISHMTFPELIENINAEIGTSYHTVHDLIENQERILAQDVYTYHTRSWKTNFDYTTFIPAETMKLILEYLETIPTQKLDATQHVFRTNSNDKPLLSKSISSSFNYLSKQCGFEEPQVKGQYGIFAPHQLRRYFFTNVMNTVGSTYADMWTGHKLSEVHSAYIRVDQSMIDKYRECLPVLSVTNQSLTLSEKSEYEILKEKQDMILDVYQKLDELNLLEKVELGNISSNQLL